MEGHGLDRSGSGQEQVAGCCEYGDEPSGFIKCGAFPEQLRTLVSREGLCSME